MKSIKIKLTKDKMSIQKITVTNDDGTEQVFVDQSTITPVSPETIAVPLNTPIEIVSR